MTLISREAVELYDHQWQSQHLSHIHLLYGLEGCPLLKGSNVQNQEYMMTSSLLSSCSLDKMDGGSIQIHPTFCCMATQRCPAIKSGLL